MRHDQGLAEARHDLYGPLLSCTQGGHQHKDEDDILSPESLTILHSLLLLAHLKGIPLLPGHSLQGAHQEHNSHVQGQPRL